MLPGAGLSRRENGLEDEKRRRCDKTERRGGSGADGRGCKTKERRGD